MFGLTVKKRIRVSLPGNVRVIAIGDIHGQLDRLMDVMSKVERYRKKNPAKEEHIVFLGDYTDRGPQSARVVDYLCERRKSAKNAKHVEIYLKGNHEELLLDAFAKEGRREEVWWRNGGKQAVKSYLEYAMQPLDDANNTRAALDIFRKIFPISHQEFYQALSSSYRVGPLLFVHAGIRMDVSPGDQNKEDLFWIRGPFLNWKGPQKEYLVVHGHSITRDFRPEILSHRIGVDTGSYRTKGRITAAIFETNEVRFFSGSTQSNFGKGPFA